MVIKDLVYTKCWNCGHKEWWDYSNYNTKPKICPSCHERFMSSTDKEIIDEFMSRLI